jgi:RNA polymerase sigma-70 factor (sigma-E family)
MTGNFSAVLRRLSGRRLWKEETMAEPAGFEHFARTASDDLFRYAYWLSGDSGRAEDLVQQSLVAVWRNWDRTDERRRRAYAKGVMSRRSASWWRRRASREHVGDVEPVVVHDPHVSTDDVTTLAVALAALPPRQRAVVLLRHVEDMSEEDVAAALGCAVGTVKSQNAKALRKLRADGSLRDAYPGRDTTRTA